MLRRSRCHILQWCWSQQQGCHVPLLALALPQNCAACALPLLIAGADFLTVLGSHEGEGLVVEHDAAVRRLPLACRLCRQQTAQLPLVCCQQFPTACPLHKHNAHCLLGRWRAAAAWMWGPRGSGQTTGLLRWRSSSSGRFAAAAAAAAALSTRSPARTAAAERVPAAPQTGRSRLPPSPCCF